MPKRGITGATICEGYDAYYNGTPKNQCPYPDTNEIAHGTKSLTCSTLRKDWLNGWNQAAKELQNPEDP